MNDGNSMNDENNNEDISVDDEQDNLADRNNVIDGNLDEIYDSDLNSDYIIDGNNWYLVFIVI